LTLGLKIKKTMKRASTRTAKRLIGNLIKCTKYQFIDMCFELLSVFYDDLDIDYDLNIIVSGGNIFYCLATDKKELEVTDFNNNHIDTIFSTYKNISYLTILYHKNLIDKSIRIASQDLIIGIYEKYAFDSISAYTPTAFIEYIFAQAREVLYKSIEEANNKFKKEYQKRLSQEKIYIEDVPFYVKNERKTNPKKYIFTQFIDKQNSSAKSWTFVISEFGFGKTSLLVNLPNKKLYKYIYMPLSQFHKNSFSNETELAKTILEIILEKKLDTNNKTIDSIFATEFRQLLRFQKDIILLYDGLDEYRLSYDEKGLKQIFLCSTAFVCNSIFTLRKEFFDERNATFQTALEVKQKPKYSYIELQEWSNKEILKYIYELKNKIDKKEDSYTYLVEFETLIKQKKYNDIYGDIPKRPLFLKMLCDDIMTGKTQIKNIFQLYESYLTKKFILDREGSSISSKTNRPLSKAGDIYFVTDYIFELLAKVSWEMITIDGTKVLYNESISEKNIIKLIKSEYDEFGSIIEILLNSVLIPFDKRKRRDFKAKFAHKSFQEYFLAYYLIFILFENEQVDITALMLRYTQGTMKFCKYMIEEVNGLQERIDQIFINLNIDIDVDSLLYKLVTVDAHLQKSKRIQQNIKDEREFTEYDFFISHSSKDKTPFVEELVCELEKLGLKIFYDKNNIAKAENIVLKINNGFVNLKYGTIAIVSPNFINSSWCNEELAIAYSLKVEKNKKLIPVLLNISDSDMKEKFAILRAIKAIDTATVSLKSLVQEIKDE
jgi:hypothetical protein